MGEVIKRQKNGKFIGWYIRYYDSDGKRRIKASKQPTHNEARRMLLQIEAQIARGENGVAEPKSKLTVAELRARFLDAAHPRAKCEVQAQCGSLGAATARGGTDLGGAARSHRAVSLL